MKGFYIKIPEESCAIFRTTAITRVGDGRSALFWEDRWIPTTATMRPLFRPPATMATMVSDLIDEVNWTWKHDLVRDTFIAPDAEAILNIPLRQGGGEDLLARAHERTGIYSVKSA